MKSVFTPVETHLVHELADTFLFGVLLNDHDFADLDGGFLALGLQQMFDTRVLSTECAQETIDALKARLQSMNNQEAAQLVEEYKGHTIEWL
jgi:hypothetical protein